MAPPENNEPATKQAEKNCQTDPTSKRSATGYMPIENYALIGNLHTCAMVATDGGLDFMCWPEFDSPSVFCRILDKDKGGHFTISPRRSESITTKQQYLPNCNILQTRYLQEEGVLNVLDFFPRPKHAPSAKASAPEGDSLKKWLVRRVECIRGSVDVDVEVFPAFNYAQDKHTTHIKDEKSSAKGGCHQCVTFKSSNLSLQLDATIDCGEDGGNYPSLVFNKTARRGFLGEGITARFTLTERQAVSFVLRDHSTPTSEEHITTALLDRVQKATQTYWFNWISKSRYTGRWREVVSRSLLLLKMLTYEPTGAIIASPTFSLPEHIGGGRNWDYRFSWVRDSSFTIYILLRMGFSDEAEAYMDFISDRFRHSRKENGELPIMFSIRGSTDLPELELPRLEGYRKSTPVRIGNGAAFHKQLDIYGELLDAVYLYNKYGKPISYDQWVAVREIADLVCTLWQQEDMSIWEVRSRPQQFVYSKVMLWVALDRSIRLTDKRSNLPCLPGQRERWLAARDAIYEQVMEKGYNSEMHCFVQSYEANDVLDSAVLIAPLVFFVAPNDPLFTNTLEWILKPPEKGGLTSAGLVYRYNTLKSEDGVGGGEGAFSMCSFWLIEALTRAGAYHKPYLVQAVNLFENMLSYANHLCMFSEEIARSGEQLGNTPQAFSHLALVSAAINLDRTLAGHQSNRM